MNTWNSRIARNDVEHSDYNLEEKIFLRKDYYYYYF